jgi:hypothetical protein
MYRIGDSYKAALELGKIRSTREIAATSHQEKKPQGSSASRYHQLSNSAAARRCSRTNACGNPFINSD